MVRFRFESQQTTVIAPFLTVDMKNLESRLLHLLFHNLELHAGNLLRDVDGLSDQTLPCCCVLGNATSTESKWIKATT